MTFSAFKYMSSRHYRSIFLSFDTIQTFPQILVIFLENTKQLAIFDNSDRQKFYTILNVRRKMGETSKKKGKRI